MQSCIRKCYRIACSFALLLLILYGHSCTPDISDQSHWQTLELPPYGWTIKAPKGSYVRLGDNMSPIPGQLYCNGFVLRFASNKEEMGCSNHRVYVGYQELIARGGDTVYYGKSTPHYTYIDSIDNN